MIFGRRNRRDEELGEEGRDVVEELGNQEDAVTDAEDTPQAEPAQDDATPEELTWREWDQAFDREEGPFDIEEVDLEADQVKRIDLGTLVVTPFPNMKMQLQVDKKQQKVQALLVSDGSSAIETAVFAGPSRTSMIPEIRDEILQATQRGQGRATLVRGPFGTEIHRRMPVTDAKGNPAMHLSRTWLVGGPGWVLRGIVMGKAALEYKDPEAQLTLFEFFSNLVVRRGTEPAVPGSVLSMTVPTLDKQGSDDADAEPRG